MRPNFLTECLDDIEQTKDYIAAYSPSAADKFVDGIFNSVEKLLTFPEHGRTVPEINRPAIREVFYRQYRIIYEVLPNGRIDVVMVQSSRLPLDEGRLNRAT